VAALARKARDRTLLPALLSFPSGFVAVIAGWFTAEIGRQPWVVYGLVRTTDTVRPSLTGGEVLFSLLAYIAVYSVIYAFGFYYVYRLLHGGPAEEPEAVSPQRPMALAMQGGDE
jgi:cytochrome d ubiquinol oxidase subunit I